jgi:CrcB protein
MTLSLPLILAVLAAGALGAVLRFAVVHLFAQRAGTATAAAAASTAPATATATAARTTTSATTAPSFPWAILVVNGVGSALGGLILGLHSVDALAPAWTLILLTGLCGGLTTFSTFSVDTIVLADRGRTRIAVANVALNVGVGLAAAGLAFGIVIFIFQ